MLFGNRAGPGSIWKARSDWFSRVRRCSPPTDGPITVLHEELHMGANICGCLSGVKKNEDPLSGGGSGRLPIWGGGRRGATTRSAIPATAAISLLAASSAVCSPLAARYCVRVLLFVFLTVTGVGDWKT
ncbi:hypothetical protein O3P69_011567 [Scylla paramamosain]|uniref:Uncharacterized protein n=1 Tax=Scylla paramamosain TaxID=85552 RepID=A0AAW0T7C6_SCYPA